MKKRFLYLGSAFLALVFSGCANSIIPKHQAGVIDESFIDEEGNFTEPIDIVTHQENQKPTDPYKEGVVLVKTHNEIDISTLELDIKSLEELYPHSPWKKINLNSGTTFDAVQYLRNSGRFQKVDYDYIMKSEEVVESLDVSSNPYAQDLPYIDTSCIGWAWWWPHFPGQGGEEQNYEEAKSEDVVVAVIDTGVDYNHIDLRNNIWTNTGEIPNNGKDDDGNGYVDDVHGWDCVNEDKDPMDDNGHGTHVAGIIAAEDNNIGTVGVAFNSKIMPIKAGTSSGTFTNADIAQAIQYAYMNGASVINMSFGGTSLSVAVEDALSEAYNQCVLVAAAGNNALCDEPGCPLHGPYATPFYPAALPYVVGVMSCNADGSSISAFSNFDHFPYNEFEYDCYACGEQITSLWPNNKYATMSGTSMSAPVVSGIAALIRTANPDRETCSTKYIVSQLSNTGTVFPSEDSYHPLCDAYEALTKVPTPHIYNLYRWYAFDNVELDPSTNNGDGFIDAGEKIRIGVELQNRGGKASNITAKIDTIRNQDSNLTDPNITILQDTIHIDNIGTFSIQDGGKVYDGDKVVDMTNAFVVRVSPNTNNGYSCVFNFHVEYYNGLQNDNIKYYGDCTFNLMVNRGYRISGAITEDTVFTSEKSYIIDGIVTIPENVTVIFDEGCLIEFYSNSSGYVDTAYNTPKISVYGTLLINGSSENRNILRPASNFKNYQYLIRTESQNAVVNIINTDITNLVCLIRGGSMRPLTKMENCTYKTDAGGDCYLGYINQGRLNFGYSYFKIDQVVNSIIDLSESYCISFTVDSKLLNSFVNIGQYSDCCFNISSIYKLSEAKNNIFVFAKSKIAKSNSFGSLSVYFNGSDTTFENNSFITSFSSNLVKEFGVVDLTGSPINSHIKGNLFCDFYQEYSNELIQGLVASNGTNVLDLEDLTNHDDSIIWPYIKDISILDKHNNKVHTVGAEENKVRVTFSRDMDRLNKFSLFYGSAYPYSDYEIKGKYVSDTVWEGTLKVRATIEGGIQYFSSNGGCANGCPFNTLIDNSGSFTFNIDTSSAFSMNLQANSTTNGIELSWVQDDYDTLMGYNIYRSTSKDGNFTRVNTSVIPSDENTFLDDSCEPGKTYWYTFTVVLSDFSESAPAGKVSATAIDTISPVIYHTPVNQGYENNNLVINCTISDNITVTGATLFYRTVGESVFKFLPMSRANNRFSATIFGNEVVLGGLEYYISATDGHNIITRGSAESPFTVIVKDASTLNNLGDVDGDGTITTKDALMIIRAINEELILTPDQFYRADLNKDEELSTFEALRILQYINGNVTSLEM